DYTGKKNGAEYAIATRTGLFGEICLKKNDEEAIHQYINYLNRQHGSAEEELSFVFERLFQKQARSVLSQVGNDKYSLDHLVWGFLNNHYSSALTTKNYKKIFFEISPKIKEIYPKYKKSIDYLLQQIYGELKTPN
ncbi:MAG TPA: hypothetical protein VK671_07335, partial [Mucilaginibacter sp.]|nr:hypothetical protein [Mucilaginibacter sp.]